MKNINLKILLNVIKNIVKIINIFTSLYKN